MEKRASPLGLARFYFDFFGIIDEISFVEKIMFRLSQIMVLLTLGVVVVAACAPSTATSSTTLPPEQATADPEAGGSSSAVDCQVYQSPFPETSELDQVLGAEDAPVTLIEYGDYQCPYCAQLEPVLAQLRAKYGKSLRFIYRQFPLISIHDKAALTSQAAEAAANQGKFWEMHAFLYKQQGTWASLSVDAFKDWIIEQAASLDLDVNRFEKELESQDVVARVQDAYAAAANIGIDGTPTLVINGQFYFAGMDYASLAQAVEKYAKIKPFTQCPPMEIDPSKEYTAKLKTSKGDMVMRLFADQTPITVNSFVFLARHGWFDNVMFHRVIPGFVAQTGDPYGTGQGNPGYTFRDEIVPGYSFAEAGMVGMANAGANTNGCQFFITYAGIPEEVVSRLDGNYTFFGKMLSGMEVLESLTPRDPAQDPNPPPADVIISVSIEEK